MRHLSGTNDILEGTKNAEPGVRQHPDPADDSLAVTKEPLVQVLSHTHPLRHYWHEQSGNEYSICPETEGVLIPLGGKKYPGRFALVDADDVPRVVQHRWTACNPTGTRGDRLTIYAKGTVDGRKVLLHRFIYNVTDRRVKVDHINHNPLDNRRTNVRLVTHQQNMFNMRSNVKSTSPYKGVSWAKQSNRWRAVIVCNGRTFHIGNFEDEEDAARAYDAKAKEVFGEYAYLNSPEEAR